jgi:hypothetical protein
MEVRYLAHAKQMQALELIPQLAAAEFKAVFGRDSRRPDAPTAPRMPRPSSSPWARCWARSRTPSTKCARPATRSACSASPLPPLPAGQRRRRAAERKRFVVLEKSLAVGIGGIVSPTCAWRCHRHGPQGLHRGRRPRRPRHHHEVAHAPCSRKAGRDELDLVTSSTSTGRWSTSSSNATRNAPFGPGSRSHAARHRRRRRANY